LLRRPKSTGSCLKRKKIQLEEVVYLRKCGCGGGGDWPEVPKGKGERIRDKKGGPEVVGGVYNPIGKPDGQSHRTKKGGNRGQGGRPNCSLELSAVLQAGTVTLAGKGLLSCARNERKVQMEVGNPIIWKFPLIVKQKKLTAGLD